MPSLGPDMEAGTLVEWLIKPGDDVHRGDIIAVVETHKGAIEIEVFEDGVLETYLAEIGKTIPVGTPMAVIRGAGQDVPSRDQQLLAAADATTQKKEVAPAEPVHKTAPDTKPDQTVSGSSLPSGKPGMRVRITPAARRRAKESGLDLMSFENPGFGPEGVITLADVEARIDAKPGAPGAAANVAGPMEKSGMRKAIAAAMSRSKREIPHYYLGHTIDLSKAAAFVTQTNANRPPAERLLLGALYLKAVARALGKYPEFNGHFTGDIFHPNAAAHIGMAIRIRGGGLVAPAIHNTESLDLDSVMSAIRDLVSRVRAGRFRSSELSDPTITISSLGDRGVDTLYGVIYPPQVALIGIGTPSTRPWVQDGVLVPRQIANISLAADHRVSDGHQGALFLRAISNFLQAPETL